MAALPELQGCLQELTTWGGLLGGTYTLVYDIKERLENLGAEPHFLPFAPPPQLETALLTYICGIDSGMVVTIYFIYCIFCLLGTDLTASKKDSGVTGDSPGRVTK